MTRSFLALVLLLQGVPAVPPQTAARGSIAGVVVNSASGDPIPNVLVTLTRVSAVPPTVTWFPKGMGQGSGFGLDELEFMMMESVIASRRNTAGTGNSQNPDEAAFLASLGKIDSIVKDSVGNVSIVSRSVPPIETDGAGRYAFQNLEPGTYKLSFAANGLVKQEYGQLGSNPGMPLVLEAGKSLTDLTTRLTPTGTVTGRVTDGAGKPLAAVTVQLSRLSYDAWGKKKAQPTLSTRTDNRGEYRFYYVTPGRYFVNAGNKGGVLDRGTRISPDALLLGISGAIPSENRIADQRHMLSYYPGTTDVRSATTLDVAAGGQVSDIDFTLMRQGAYNVRGRIADPRGGGPPKSMSSIYITDPEDGGGAPVGKGPNYNPADGTFEFREVPSGSYLLTMELPAVDPESTVPSLSPAARQAMSEAERREYGEAMGAAFVASETARPRAAVPITVGDSDLDGLLVSPSSGWSLKGRFRIEGDGVSRLSQKEKDRLLERFEVEFWIAGPDGVPVGRYNSSQPLIRARSFDGMFTVVGGIPREYWLHGRSIPEGYYVKSARLGDVDALHGPITLPASDPNLALDIVVSSNVGQIDGVAATAEGRPLAGAQVALIPDRSRDRSELFRPVEPDAAGHFIILNVEPGEYHLAAWTVLAPYDFFDPKSIKQAQEKGKALRVDESTKQTVTIEPITTPEGP